jgi:hypothetical protein
MTISASNRQQALSTDINAVADLILSVQKQNGEIPWSGSDKTDPWDHTEAAMGLTTSSCFQEARCAFLWLAETQLKDGSWYSSYKNGIAVDKTRETNMSTYLAVGLYHYYLATGDIRFLRRMWKPLSLGIRFALNLQAASGEIYWAVSPEGIIDKMALLTASSSIFMSLKCALAIAHLLKHSKPTWESAYIRLGAAIKHKPYLFNMTKSRYSMDWFYPVLSGVLTGTPARLRIESHWKKFVIRGQGVRCVSDEPWVTLAETSELSLALSAMGNHALAKILFNWICDKKFEDGSFWCGFTYPEMVTWPEDKITWSNAVVLMAADAIYDLTPAARLFYHQFWDAMPFLPKIK